MAVAELGTEFPKAKEEFIKRKIVDQIVLNIQ